MQVPPCGVCLKFGVRIRDARNINSQLSECLMGEQTQPTNMAATMFEARVVSVDELAPTVRRLKLYVPDLAFCFKPGQWIDFQPSALPENLMGGYSICSSPASTEWLQDRILELAIKLSNHAVVQWVHSADCQVGSIIRIAAGGPVWFDYNKHITSEGSSVRPALFLAAGVGITPLISMLRYIRDMQFLSLKSALMYSARGEADLMYRSELSTHPQLDCQYFVTGSNAVSSYVHARRISEQDIRDRLQRLTDGKPQRALCYVCGPPAFLDDVTQLLIHAGCDSKSIIFEKWW
jgi:ferredoxin-NADP reductase